VEWQARDTAVVDASKMAMIEEYARREVRDLKDRKGFWEKEENKKDPLKTDTGYSEKVHHEITNEDLTAKIIDIHTTECSEIQQR
jgi:hypothetical protein